MPYLKKNKKIELVGSELEVFLTTGIGVFSWFKGKKIKFNPRPFSEKKKLDETEKNLVDFHLEMVKKIDTLIEEHEREKETVFEEVPDSISQEELEDSLEEIVEMREPFKRKLEIPDFKTEMQPESIFDNIDVEKEEFEITLPGEIHRDFKFVTNLEEPKDIVYVKNIESGHVKDDDLHSRMLDSQDKMTQNSTMGFARVRSKKKMANLKEQKTKNKKQKVISKTQNRGTEVTTTKKKKSKKKNGLEKTRKEVEKARREVEKKKKELGVIEEEIKKKEKDLKRKKIERIRKKKEEKQVKKVEMEQSYIPVNFNHRWRKFKEKEKEELEKEEIERQRAEMEKLKKLELKKAKELAKKKEKELKEKKKELEEKAKLEAKKKRLEAKHDLKEEMKKKEEAERQKELKMKTAEKKKTGIFTKKEKPSSLATKHSLSRKKNLEQEQPVLDDDIRKVLLITDNLLEKLPEDVIDEFVQSEDFSLYEKVISKYKVK